MTTPIKINGIELTLTASMDALMQEIAPFGYDYTQKDRMDLFTGREGKADIEVYRDADNKITSAAIYGYRLRDGSLVSMMLFVGRGNQLFASKANDTQYMKNRPVFKLFRAAIAEAIARPYA